MKSYLPCKANAVWFSRALPFWIFFLVPGPSCWALLVTEFQRENGLVLVKIPILPVAALKILWTDHGIVVGILLLGPHSAVRIPIGFQNHSDWCIRFITIDHDFVLDSITTVEWRTWISSRKCQYRTFLLDFDLHIKHLTRTLTLDSILWQHLVSVDIVLLEKCISF